jgi:hypothetical protein
MDEQTDPGNSALTTLSRLINRTEKGIERRINQIAELEAEAAAIRAETKRLRQIESVLSIVIAEYESKHWCEVVRQIDRAKDLGAALDQFAEGTSGELVSVRQSAVKQAEEAVGELSSSLPEALNAEGLSLDLSSRFPSFKLKRGFFEIKIVKTKWEAQIIVRHGPTLKIAADLDLIITAVLGEESRCFGSPIDLSVFLARLRAAYGAVLGTEKLRPLPLDEVRLMITDPEIARDEFAVALSAVLGKQPPEAAGMKLDHTKVIEAGFLLPGFEDRGYFGHISFTKP